MVGRQSFFGSMIQEDLPAAALTDVDGKQWSSRWWVVNRYLV